MKLTKQFYLRRLKVTKILRNKVNNSIKHSENTVGKKKSPINGKTSCVHSQKT